MKLVPKTGRTAWHEKAMDAAKGTDLRALIELFIEIKEMGRLAELVRGATDEALEQASHYATEPAGKKLEGVHPGLAARLWRAQGMRIVDGAKSKDYDAALSTSSALGAAMSGRPRRRMGGHRARYSARHHRKTGFMSGFEALAAPAGAASLRFWIAPRNAGACGTTRRSETRRGSGHGRTETPLPFPCREDIPGAAALSRCAGAQRLLSTSPSDFVVAHGVHGSASRTRRIGGSDP